MAAFGCSDWALSEKSAIAQRLQMQLGPEYVSVRSGNGGLRVHYLEGHKAIELANKVFGYNGWSSSIIHMDTDFVDEHNGRYNVGICCTLRVTLRCGAYHEDVGYGMIENARQKGAALEKAKKEAATDALKRCLRYFGNALGNCMYDKSFTKDISKVQSMGNQKLDADNLMRPSTNTGIPSVPLSSAAEEIRASPSTDRGFDEFDTSMENILIDLATEERSELHPAGQHMAAANNQVATSLVNIQPAQNVNLLQPYQKSPPLVSNVGATSMISSNQSTFQPPTGPPTTYKNENYQCPAGPAHNPSFRPNSSSSNQPPTGPPNIISGKTEPFQNPLARPPNPILHSSNSNNNPPMATNSFSKTESYQNQISRPHNSNNSSNNQPMANNVSGNFKPSSSGKSNSTAVRPMSYNPNGTTRPPPSNPVVRPNSNAVDRPELQQAPPQTNYRPPPPSSSASVNSNYRPPPNLNQPPKSTATNNTSFGVGPHLNQENMKRMRTN